MENKEQLQESPLYCIEAFLKVRDSGIINMFDATGVINIMIENGDVDAAVYLLKESNDDRLRVDIAKYSQLTRDVSEVLSLADILNKEGK